MSNTKPDSLETMDLPKKHSDSLMYRACFRKKTERVPVWFMRQAGRYLKEYRVLREKYSFLDLCKNPEIASEVTLLPVNLIEVDCAILFADILLPLECMGVNLHFGEGGPRLEYSPFDTLRLGEVEEELSFVMRTIRISKEKLKKDIPLIGFAGAPFTLLSYLIEGKGSPSIQKTKLFLHQYPKRAKEILSQLSEMTIRYLKAQMNAGVDAVQIFDSWAGLLSHLDWLEFCLPYLDRVLQGIKKDRIPRIVFARGIGNFYQNLSQLDLEVLSLDWSVDLAQVKEEIGHRIAIQGNFDPYFLYSDKHEIRKQAQKLLDSIKDKTGYIFNLGHGVLPDLRVDHVRYLVECVHELGQIKSS